MAKVDLALAHLTSSFFGASALTPLVERDDERGKWPLALASVVRMDNKMNFIVNLLF